MYDLSPASSFLLTKPNVLQAIYEILRDAPQNSSSLKRASNDVTKSVAKPEICKHKDKEVRLYATGCMLYILKLHAPDSPFSDPQMETFFTQLIATFRELHDPSGTHFEFHKTLLETTADLKCCLLIYDLTDNTEAIVLELFTTLLDSLNSENLQIIQEPTLLLLSTMVDDGEEPSQQLLDTILGRILPSTTEDNLAAHHLADALIRKCQSALQPSVQKFLTRLLEGRRTESELAGHCSDLILALHKTVPQITLPVLPHLAPSLVVDSEERRLDAVNLIASLLTATGAQSLLEDYPALPEALLGRMNDRCSSIRVQVLSHAQSLVAASNTDELRRQITSAVSLRLQDPDEKVRIKGVQSLVSILIDHPLLTIKEDLAALTARLRDKRLPVRKEAATQTAKLVRSWTLRWEDAFAAPTLHKKYVAQLALGLCAMALSHDTELTWHILEDVFRISNSANGVFSPKLSTAAAAGWWIVIWKAGNKQSRGCIFTLLQNMCAVQSQVQELLQLREAIKTAAKRQDDGMNDASHMEMGMPVGGVQDKEQVQLQNQLEKGISHLAVSLGNRVRIVEGLQRIWTMKDNNIFKALTVLADCGTPLTDAHAAGKELVSRVGNRGAVAEAAVALVSRMIPAIISPEIVESALEATHEQSTRGDYGFEFDDEFLLDIADAAPQLFASLMPTLSKLLTSDDQIANELAAKVLSKAGQFVGLWASHLQQEISPSSLQALVDLCSRATPAGAKAAVKSIVYLEKSAGAGGSRRAPGLLKQIASEALRALADDKIGISSSHSRVLACLKSISSVLRAVPEFVEDFGLEFYDFVMNDLLMMDMSRWASKTLQIFKNDASEQRINPHLLLL